MRVGSTLELMYNIIYDECAKTIQSFHPEGSMNHYPNVSKYMSENFPKGFFCQLEELLGLHA